MSRAKATRAELIAAVVDGGRRLSTATIVFHETVAERLGLHTTDHKCLGIAQEAGPITAGELASRTGLTTGAITGVIDRLESRGFVRREADPVDRRKVVVRVVAERVEREVRPLFESLAGAVTALAKTYDEAQLRIVTDYMEDARAVLEAEAARLRSSPAPRASARSGKRGGKAQKPRGSA
ncbi:MAG TPA: MarR family transcriptional regulator [Burkholderiales bacterium]|nr:MarR family transcriptional regulator [Burkholderiales bacterium]